MRYYSPAIFYNWQHHDYSNTTSEQVDFLKKWYTAFRDRLRKNTDGSSNITVSDIYYWTDSGYSDPGHSMGFILEVNNYQFAFHLLADDTDDSNSASQLNNYYANGDQTLIENYFPAPRADGSSYDYNDYGNHFHIICNSGKGSFNIPFDDSTAMTFSGGDFSYEANELYTTSGFDNFFPYSPSDNGIVPPVVFNNIDTGSNNNNDVFGYAFQIGFVVDEDKDVLGVYHNRRQRNHYLTNATLIGKEVFEPHPDNDSYTQGWVGMDIGQHSVYRARMNSSCAVGSDKDGNIHEFNLDYNTDLTWRNSFKNDEIVWNKVGVQNRKYVKGWVDEQILRNVGAGTGFIQKIFVNPDEYSNHIIYHQISAYMSSMWVQSEPLMPHSLIDEVYPPNYNGEHEPTVS